MKDERGGSRGNERELTKLVQHHFSLSDDDGDTGGIFLMIIIVCVLIIFTVMIFSPSRQLHTPTNLLLLSLAVSDFLVGLLVMPFQILLTEPCWFLGDFICALYYVLPYITVNASIGNMVLISVDHYVAICDPLLYSSKISKKNIQISVLLCWFYCTFYSFMILYDNLKQPGRVFVVAVSQARSMRSHIAAVKLQRSVTVTVKKSELKAARTLGVVVAVFLMCYCPPYSVCLSGYDLKIGSSTTNFIVFLLFSNSCLNPVIYVFLYPWFRKCVKLILTLTILQPHSRHTKVL
uniref:G-protein coupled receptors family 1 profile domain-containing protein n=1 Tax=Anabas testudineus TaxID=64144 RepID=A0A3Q1JQZ2_ANATE